MRKCFVFGCEGAGDHVGTEDDGEVVYMCTEHSQSWNEWLTNDILGATSGPVDCVVIEGESDVRHFVEL